MDQAEGALLPDAMGSGALTLVHDPWRAVPGRGGHLGLDPGPCLRGDLDARCDVACFTSPVLSEPLHLLFRKNDTQANRLREVFNAGLRRLAKNGELERLQQALYSGQTDQWRAAP